VGLNPNYYDCLLGTTPTLDTSGHFDPSHWILGPTVNGLTHSDSACVLCESNSSNRLKTPNVCPHNIACCPSWNEWAREFRVTWSAPEDVRAPSIAGWAVRRISGDVDSLGGSDEHRHEYIVMPWQHACPIHPHQKKKLSIIVGIHVVGGKTHSFPWLILCKTTYIIMVSIPAENMIEI
jgi:hypothetical protein